MTRKGPRVMVEPVNLPVLLLDAADMICRHAPRSSESERISTALRRLSHSLAAHERIEREKAFR